MSIRTFGVPVIKGVVAGGLIYAVADLILPGVSGISIPTTFGSFTGPLALGMSAGLAITGTDLLINLALPSAMKQQLNNTLGSYSEPIVAAAMTAIVSNVFLGIPASQTLIMVKLAAGGAVGAIVGDKVGDLIEGYLPH